MRKAAWVFRVIVILNTACLLPRAEAQTTVPIPASVPSPILVMPNASESKTPTDAAMLQAIQHNLDQLRIVVETPKPESWLHDWSPVIAGILSAAISAAIAVIALNRNLETTKESLERTLKMQAASIAEKAREEQRSAIRRQIDEFYAPFMQLRNASQFYYHELFMPRRSEVERKNFSDGQGNYRTLIALVRGHVFEGVDKTLLTEIIECGKKTASLITEKVGLVDDQKLQQLLARAIAHYRLMDLAFTNSSSLSPGSAEFDKVTFPSEMDQLIQTKLNELNARLATLHEPVKPS